MPTSSVGRDEDLALFHEMQKRDHARRNAASLPVSDNAAAEVQSGRVASMCKTGSAGATAIPYRIRTAGEELLASDMGKNDYDWLLTPPATPLVMGSDNDPVADMAFFSSQKNFPNLVRSLVAAKSTRNSRDSLGRVDQSITNGRNITTNTANRRLSIAPAGSNPSSRPASRPSTPTSRSAVASASTSSNNRHPAGSSTARAIVSSRSATPLRRPSTPVLSRSHNQSASTPAGRSSSAGRVSSMPLRSNPPSSRGSSPITRHQTWQPPDMPGFSLEPPPNLRTSIPSRSLSNPRGASVSSSRQSTTPMQGMCTTSFSKQATSSSSSTTATTSKSFSKPGTLLSPTRPARPGSSLLSWGSSRATSSSSSSINPSSTSILSTSSPSSTNSSRAADILPDRSRRQSCSPSRTRGRTSTTERPLSRSSRVDSSPCRDAAGRSNKVGDRMVHSRRAAALSLSPERTPVSQARRATNTRPTTPIAKENAGHGKSVSRKSIDMALRHMELRQSFSNGLRPLLSNIPSMPFHMVRSVGGRYLPVTSNSTTSSDHNISMSTDVEGSELEDVASEIGSRASPRCAQDPMLSVTKEERVTTWVDSAECIRESNIELLQKLRKGMDDVNGMVASSPSPRCQHLHAGMGSGPCELCKLKSRLRSLKAKPAKVFSSGT
ncbi:hypothetical protein KP509_31G009200 [Ceratopteris richardii]|uniref:Uncharacterized protein n=1 Tax=Ceratopteris richardii TaxID=49495 RepID=A0A8T2QVN8_CERRI|nr:hypothetical protein KP509_31G009200 [Ceratopteris richardii]